jgi:hypothetical protein
MSTYYKLVSMCFHLDSWRYLRGIHQHPLCSFHLVRFYKLVLMQRTVTQKSKLISLQNTTMTNMFAKTVRQITTFTIAKARRRKPYKLQLPGRTGPDERLDGLWRCYNGHENGCTHIMCADCGLTHHSKGDSVKLTTHYPCGSRATVDWIMFIICSPQSYRYDPNVTSVDLKAKWLKAKVDKVSEPEMSRAQSTSQPEIVHEMYLDLKSTSMQRRNAVRRARTTE